jgi:hypothetical protein
LLLLLLARDAPLGPGHRLQALLVQLLLAHDTDAEAAILDPDERLVHELEHVALRVGEAEQELLRVGVGGLVRDVLRALFVRFPAVALALRVGDQDLLLLLQKLLPEAFHLLLFH